MKERSRNMNQSVFRGSCQWVLLTLLRGDFFAALNATTLFFWKKKTAGFFVPYATTTTRYCL